MNHREAYLKLARLLVQAAWGGLRTHHANTCTHHHSLSLLCQPSNQVQAVALNTKL